jgi:hypothetical protein
MDLLLKAIDQVKQHMTEIEIRSRVADDAGPGSGRDADGDRRGPRSERPARSSPSPRTTRTPADTDGAAARSQTRARRGEGGPARPLRRGSDDQLVRLGEQVELLADAEARGGITQELEEIGGDLYATIDFFEFDSMGSLTNAVIEAAAIAAQSPDVDLFAGAAPDAGAPRRSSARRRKLLARGELVDPEHGDLVAHLRAVVENGSIDDAWRLPADADAETVLQIDNALATIREIQAEADAALSGDSNRQASEPAGDSPPQPAPKIIPEPG